MRTFKLWIHQKTSFNGDELVINPKEFSDVKNGSLVEIYHPDDVVTRLLLQVRSLREDFQQKETISVEQSIAAVFQLRNYQDVCVNVVAPHSVSLDLVELCFKDQYFSRSDMWRLSQSLIGTCVYQTKKIEFSEMRVNVNEIWAKGERMSCGFITPDTKVVYRSSTAVINIFIQMSCEMWEFDAVGDLYFEKANEFLKALFAKWSEKNCCHDVTMVMFSRTFYNAKSRDEFPACMRDCIQEDYMGRFYEDFYRVVAQNERFDEWTSIVNELKLLFVGYRDRVLKFHCNCGHEQLQSYNSTAAQGNFLEVINMSLNVYENFNIDRNFDRTGKMAMVITPGAGVFEVNRELTNVTKQRTIDNGIGMDIVCMAEQPLHVVPLFKFHSKSDQLSFEVGDDYNLPHWINISFYQSASQVQLFSSSSFVPRIKFGLKTQRRMFTLRQINHISEQKNDNFPFLDYDEYDAQVFKIPNSLGAVRWRRNRSNSVSKPRLTMTTSSEIGKQRARTVSDDFRGTAKPLSSSFTVDTATSERFGRETSTDSIIGLDQSTRWLSQESLLDSESEFNRCITGSDTSLGSKLIRARKTSSQSRPTRALINPFAPARMNFKVTSNRRRWIHAFPMDSRGTTIRQHCYIQKDDDETKDERHLAPKVVEAAQMAVEARKQRTRMESCSENDARCSPTLTRSSSTTTLPGQTSSGNISSITKSSSHSANLLDISGGVISSSDNTDQSGHSRFRSSVSILTRSRKNRSQEHEAKPGGWLFGPTGDSEWSPSLTLGVDWKSLCIPAQLPCTTDYFPDEETLKKYCLFPAYSLIPDDILPEISTRMEENRRRAEHSADVFKELVSQRLSQGFQLITDDKALHPTLHAPLRHAQPSLIRINSEMMEEYKMSIGRIFHRLLFNGKEIKVTRYNPMHPAPPIQINYRYRLQVPDAEVYEPCITAFANQQLEQFNWNYLDHYICSAGEGDYGLLDSFKFWRSRFFLLPAVNSATKRIIDGNVRCDIYADLTKDEINQLFNGFVRFMEALNKIRRPGPTRKSQTRKTKLPSVRKPATHAQDTSDIKPETKRIRHPSVPSKLLLENSADAATLAMKPMPPSDSRRQSATAGSLMAQIGGEATVSTGSVADVVKSNIRSLSSENLSNTLSSFSSLKDILNDMKDGVDGLSFLPKQHGLPLLCFVSSEAVSWIVGCVEGVTTDEMAIEILQRMVDAKMICHASGDIYHPFVQGFVLYNIVTDPDKRVDRESIQKFHDAFCEVAIDTRNMETSTSVPAFLLPNHELETISPASKINTTRNYRQVNVDVDSNNKSDRKEWAVAQYHTKYHPKSPFSLEIQWMVATGCIIGDLVYAYFRKASSCGYHLLPVPVDQFALPQSKFADPLRVPVFIPLKLSCLSKDTTHGLFGESGNDLRRLQLFQHAILMRFGFLHDAYSVNSSTSFGLPQDAPLKYVHCSGSIFVLIPDYPAHKINKTGTGAVDSCTTGTSPTKPRRRYSIHADFVARHGGHDNDDHQVGFLLAWNFMLSKRWRSANTGDEAFQDKMLADFRRFCSNDENRLRQFWDECWRLKRVATGFGEEQ